MYVTPTRISCQQKSGKGARLENGSTRRQQVECPSGSHQSTPIRRSPGSQLIIYQGVGGVGLRVQVAGCNTDRELTCLRCAISIAITSTVEKVDLRAAWPWRRRLGAIVVALGRVLAVPSSCSTITAGGLLWPTGRHAGLFTVVRPSSVAVETDTAAATLARWRRCRAEQLVTTTWWRRQHAVTWDTINMYTMSKKNRTLYD